MTNVTNVDPEIGAMQAIAGALGGLDEAAAQRVLRWAGERYGTSMSVTRNERTASDSDEMTRLDDEPYGDYHDLIDSANPQSGLDRILVTAYWFQVIKGEDSLESFQINRELKNLGHPSGNITRDLGKMMARSPKLVMQVRKEGLTRQARKKYRLTREGIRAVEAMLAGDARG